MPYIKAPADATVDPLSTFASGLIGCYLVNEGSGTAADLASSPVNLTPTWVESNQYISDFSVANASSTKYNWTSGPFSVAVWVKCLALNASSEYSVVVGRSTFVNSGNNQGWDLLAYPPNDNSSQFFFTVRRNTTAGDRISFGVSAVAGTDYVLVFTASGGNSRKTYANGVLKSSDNGAATPASDTTATFKNASNAAPSKFPIRQLCIWNRELSEAEAKSLYFDNLQFLNVSAYEAVAQARDAQSVVEVILARSGGDPRVAQVVTEVVVARPNTGPYLTTPRVAQHVIEVVYKPGVEIFDSLNNWADSLEMEVGGADYEFPFADSLSNWLDAILLESSGEFAVEDSFSLSDSVELAANVLVDVADYNTPAMADDFSYVMLEIVAALTLSITDSMIKTSGPQPTRFEMKDGVSYFMDAAESPLFISIDDLETYLADATAIDFRVFFNTVEGEAFDSMQYNWLDEVAFDLIINASLSEDWMFQSDDLQLVFDTLLGINEGFSLRDEVTNASITEFFEVADAMLMDDLILTFLAAHLKVGVGDFFGLADSGDSIVPLMGSANISYLRRYLNDVR